MKKIRKLVTSPGLFFRDFFNKRYPYNNTEFIFDETEETIILENIERSESRMDCSDDPVDAVFTWVDGEDKIWRKKYSSAKDTLGDCYSFFSTDEARFSNHGELYFSVHAVKKLIPWINKIYIVTDGQKPQWFIDDEQVVIIDHSEIIDSVYLPTFNSHVIEANLHKIKGLSEQFIYFNDDVFVARPLRKSHFFTFNGLSSLFVSDKPLKPKNQELKRFHTPTLDASNNSARLLERNHNYKVRNKLVHTYYPLTKKMFAIAWSQYEFEINSFLPNKFRGDNDLNLATFLVPWLAYLEGVSVDRVDICYYFNIRSPHARMQYKKLLEMKRSGHPPHSFCANDFTHVTQSIPYYREDLQDMLSGYYLDDY